MTTTSFWGLKKKPYTLLPNIKEEAFKFVGKITHKDIDTPTERILRSTNRTELEEYGGKRVKHLDVVEKNVLSAQYKRRFH